MLGLFEARGQGSKYNHRKPSIRRKDVTYQIALLCNLFTEGRTAYLWRQLPQRCPLERCLPQLHSTVACQKLHRIYMDCKERTLDDFRCHCSKQGLMYAGPQSKALPWLEIRYRASTHAPLACTVWIHHCSGTPGSLLLVTILGSNTYDISG